MDPLSKKQPLPKFSHTDPKSSDAILNGKYAIAGVLGGGGQSITYLARDHLDGEVVIKELYTDNCLRRFEEEWRQRSGPMGRLRYAWDQQANSMIGGPKVVSKYEVRPQGDDQQRWSLLVDRFLMEGKLLVELQRYKEHVVGCHDYFKANGTAYLVLERIYGPTLQRKVENEGVLDVRDVLSYTETIGQILKVLHMREERPFLHLDVKPENIMLTNGIGGRPSPKLIDFGSARPYSPPMVPDSTLFRTPHFSAPELTTDKARHDPGPHSDVYSLAATCFYCITGKFHDGPKRKQAWVLLRMRLAEHGYESVADVLEIALSPTPAKRIRRISEFLNAVDRATSSSRNVAAGPVSTASAPTSGGDAIVYSAPINEPVDPTEVINIDENKSPSPPQQRAEQSTAKKVEKVEQPNQVAEEVKARIRQHRDWQQSTRLLTIIGVSLTLITAGFFVAQLTVSIFGNEVPVYLMVAVVGLLALWIIVYLVLRKKPRPASMTGLYIVSEMTPGPPIKLKGQFEEKKLNGAELEFIPLPGTGWPRMRVKDTVNAVRVDGEPCEVGSYAARVELDRYSKIEIGSESYMLHGQPKAARHYQIQSNELEESV